MRAIKSNLILSMTMLGATLFGSTAVLAGDAVKGAGPQCCAHWTGFYAGINAGRAWGHPGQTEFFADSVTPVNLGDSRQSSRGGIGDMSSAGGVVGGQVGYNRQMGSVVLGVEADIQGSGLKGQKTGILSNPNGTFNPISGTAELDVKTFGTLRGRLGVAADKWLIYGTGGLAVAQVDYAFFVRELGGGSLFQSQLASQKVRSGTAWGGGVEYGLDRYTVKLEYLNVNLGSVDATGPVTFISNGTQFDTARAGALKAGFQTLRVGLSARF